MNASELCYWIPGDSGFSNPSDRLRHIGFRIDGSVWVIPNNHVPYNLLNEMTAAGVTWHLLEFTGSQAEKILALAKDVMEKEIAEIATRLETSIQSADQQYDTRLAESEGGKEIEKAESYYRSRTRGALKRAEQMLKDIEKAAGCFGISVGTSVSYSTIKALRTSVAARAHAYSRLTQAVVGTQLEAAAKADEVPAGVLADYVEERGGDAVAERELLSDTPVAVADEPIKAPTVEQSYQLVQGSATMTFTASGDLVNIQRHYRGILQSSKVVGKELARKEYQRLLDQGYTRF